MMHEGTCISIRNLTIDGEKFELRAYDPYGFWKAKWNGKTTPKELQGYFTSLGEIEKACTAVVSRKLSKDPDKLNVSSVNPMEGRE